MLSGCQLEQMTEIKLFQSESRRSVLALGLFQRGVGRWEFSGCLHRSIYLCGRSYDAMKRSLPLDLGVVRGEPLGNSSSLGERFNFRGDLWPFGENFGLGTFGKSDKDGAKLTLLCYPNHHKKMKGHTPKAGGGDKGRFAL